MSAPNAYVRMFAASVPVHTPFQQTAPQHVRQRPYLVVVYKMKASEFIHNCRFMKSEP